MFFKVARGGQQGWDRFPTFIVFFKASLMFNQNLPPPPTFSTSLISSSGLVKFNKLQKVREYIGAVVACVFKSSCRYCSMAPYKNMLLASYCKEFGYFPQVFFRFIPPLPLFSSCFSSSFKFSEASTPSPPIFSDRKK